MKYKYSIEHEESLPQFFYHQFKSLINTLAATSISPLETKIQTCFVVGCGHSGTTLLSARLGNSSECFALPRESSAFLPVNPLHIAKALSNEWMYFTDYLGKNVFIEKTPKHVHVPQRISKIFPNAKFIAMTRNPLDNCASLKERFRDLNFCVDRWNMDNQAISQLNSLKDRVKVIKYEDLTSQPQKTFQDVCSFLGVEYEESLILPGNIYYDQSDDNEGIKKQRSAQIAKEITPNYGKWKESLSEDEENFILRECSNIAKELGYTEDVIKNYLK